MSESSLRPSVMGIINMTPDSFSGDGLLTDSGYVAAAVARATQMIEDGADMLDIGGESSRPGSTPIPSTEEMRRVVPVIASIHEKFPAIPLAIDTVKADVAAAALDAGATIINDISALSGDAAMGKLVALRHASIVLMHNSSVPDSIKYDDKIGGQFDATLYDEIIENVARELATRVKAALEVGISRDKIILDPGVGFGKTAEQNVELIAHMYHFTALGFPVLMGVSRKSFIGHLLDLGIDERLEGTAACVTACVLQGANILRVHDVKFMSRVVKIAALLRDA